MRKHQQIFNIDGQDLKVGAHGFVFRKSGDEWIRSSINVTDLVTMQREQEIREFKAEVTKERDAARVAVRDEKRRKTLIQKRLSA